MVPTDGGLTDWFSGELGQQLLRAEQQRIVQLLGSLGCRSLLQLGGPWEGAQLVPAVGQWRSWVMEPDLLGQPEVVGSTVALPFQEGAFDTVLVPHTLETAADPGAVLQEAGRVLAPAGHLLVSGFNPASSWGVWHLAQRVQGRTEMARRRFLPLSWLRRQLQGQAIPPVGLQTLFYPPPARSLYRRSWSKNIDAIGTKISPSLGGIYLLAAQKRRVQPTLVGLDEAVLKRRPSRGMRPAVERQWR